MPAALGSDMSLGRRIVQRATTRVFRRGIKVIVRKPDDPGKPPDAEGKKQAAEGTQPTDTTDAQP